MTRLHFPCIRVPIGSGGGSQPNKLTRQINQSPRNCHVITCIHSGTGVTADKMSLRKTQEHPHSFMQFPTGPQLLSVIDRSVWSGLALTTFHRPHPRTATNLWITIQQHRDCVLVQRRRPDTGGDGGEGLCCCRNC